MPAYEQLLDRDLEWALTEGSLHFDEKSSVHRALHETIARLEGIGVDYALSGAMALFVHGYRRFTEVVDLLVTPEGLRTIHEQLTGLGFVPLFQGRRGLRETSTGVRIEFLVAGEFPGDGKPKPVSFPDPAQVCVMKSGLRILDLKTLIELKLASGMTSPGRLKDLADVQELIRILRLDAAFAAQLDPYVRHKYEELWQGVRAEASHEERAGR
jgi:hypothetical protein